MIILNIFTLYTSFYQNNLDENYIYVEIKGEVKREGVYKLKEMNEKGKYTYSILDGKQRLTNIFSFIDSSSLFVIAVI